MVVVTSPAQRSPIEPTPAEVALLAAASGIEPLDDGLDRARKRWEDRIRHWRRKLEEWDRLRSEG